MVASRRGSRKTLVAGAAALVLAAGVGAGLLALLAPGGARGRSGAAVSGGQRTAQPAEPRHVPGRDLEDDQLTGP